MAKKKTVLSTLANNVSPSVTLEVTAMVRRLEAAGEDVCGFGAGEPDFDTPAFIKAAAVAALDAGQTKYAPVAGLPALRDALANKYRSFNRVDDVTPERTVVTPGGKFACYLSLKVVCEPGDEVIIPAPYWVSYSEMVKFVGATPVFVTAKEANRFKITPEQLKAAITPKTRMVIINSPSNPTGAVYTPSELAALVEIAMAAGTYIMSDEIYEYLLYDDVEHCSVAALSKDVANSTITVSGFSKTYSMTGWRLGTLMANNEIAKAAIGIQSHITSSPTTFAQYGALAALEQVDEANAALQDMLRVFTRRRHLLLSGLQAIPGITCQCAQGAFYLYPNIAESGYDSLRFAKQLLAQEKVAVIPGIAFGTDQHIRMSYAVSEDVIERGLERLMRFCCSL